MKYLLTLLLVGFSFATFADGDRHREASPILPPDNNDCYYTVPTGIDLSTCTEVASPDHSQVVFFCSGLVPEGDDPIVVICSE